MSNNQNYNQTTYSYISNDDITLPLDVGSIPSLNTSDIITINSLGGSYDYTNMASGSVTIDTSSYGFNGSTYFGNITESSSAVKITNNGIEMPEGSDISIDGKSLKHFMDTMEKRLAILQPNPKKLEKFEALKKAYTHYKTLEALCDLEEDDEQK